MRSPRRTPWGTAPDGRPVEHVELTSDHAQVALITWGAAVQSLTCRDRHDNTADIVLGFEDLSGYTDPEQPFLGATVGRFANRIAGGRFRLEGREYALPQNDGHHTLHGGPLGFWARPWTLTEVAETPEGGAAEMALVSPDGDMGFPGRLEITTRYSLVGAVLEQTTSARTDAATVVNVTNHTYFNLHGTPSLPASDHLLTVPAARYVPVDAAAIPLPGPPAPVVGTAFDLRHPAPAVGIDHTWVIDGEPDESGLRTAAVLSDPCSGRRVTVRTTEPGVHCYSGNFLDGTLVGKDGARLIHHGGVCLETQHFPDSPNRTDYPGVVLRPGEVFRTVTRWQMDVQDS